MDAGAGFQYWWTPDGPPLPPSLSPQAAAPTSPTIRAAPATTAATAAGGTGASVNDSGYQDMSASLRASADASPFVLPNTSNYNSPPNDTGFLFGTTSTSSTTAPLGAAAATGVSSGIAHQTAGDTLSSLMSPPGATLTSSGLTTAAPGNRNQFIAGSRPTLPGGSSAPQGVGPRPMMHLLPQGSAAGGQTRLTVPMSASGAVPNGARPLPMPQPPVPPPPPVPTPYPNMIDGTPVTALQLWDGSCHALLAKMDAAGNHVQCAIKNLVKPKLFCGRHQTIDSRKKFYGTVWQHSTDCPICKKRTRKRPVTAMSGPIARSDPKTGRTDGTPVSSTISSAAGTPVWQPHAPITTNGSAPAAQRPVATQPGVARPAHSHTAARPMTQPGPNRHIPGAGASGISGSALARPASASAPGTPSAAGAAAVPTTPVAGCTCCCCLGTCAQSRAARAAAGATPGGAATPAAGPSTSTSSADSGGPHGVATAQNGIALFDSSVNNSSDSATTSAPVSYPAAATPSAPTAGVASAPIVAPPPPPPPRPPYAPYGRPSAVGPLDVRSLRPPGPTAVTDPVRPQLALPVPPVGMGNTGPQPSIPSANPPHAVPIKYLPTSSGGARSTMDGKSGEPVPIASRIGLPGSAAHLSSHSMVRPTGAKATAAKPGVAKSHHGVPGRSSLSTVPAFSPSGLPSQSPMEPTSVPSMSVSMQPRGVMPPALSQQPKPQPQPQPHPRVVPPAGAALKAEGPRGVPVGSLPPPVLVPSSGISVPPAVPSGVAQPMRPLVPVQSLPLTTAPASVPLVPIPIPSSTSPNRTTLLVAPPAANRGPASDSDLLKAPVLEPQTSSKFSPALRQLPAHGFQPDASATFAVRMTPTSHSVASSTHSLVAAPAPSVPAPTTIPVRMAPALQPQSAVKSEALPPPQPIAAVMSTAITRPLAALLNETVAAAVDTAPVAATAAAPTVPPIASASVEVNPVDSWPLATDAFSSDSNGLSTSGGGTGLESSEPSSIVIGDADDDAGLSVTASSIQERSSSVTSELEVSSAANPEERTIVRLRIPQCYLPLRLRKLQEFRSCLQLDAAAALAAEPQVSRVSDEIEILEPSTSAALSDTEQLYKAACLIDLTSAPVAGDSWLTNSLIDFITLQFAKTYHDVHFLSTNFAAHEVPKAFREEHSPDSTSFQLTDLLGRHVNLKEALTGSSSRPLVFFWNIGNRHWNMIRVVFTPKISLELFEPMGKPGARSGDGGVSVRSLPRPVLWWLDSALPVEGGWIKHASSAITHQHQTTGFDCGVACLLYAEKCGQMQCQEDIRQFTDQLAITSYRTVLQEYLKAHVGNVSL